MTSHKIALIKAISWRIVGSITTVVLFYIMTGDLKIGLSFGGIDVIVKFILYYLHERVWDRVKIRKKKDT